MNSNYFYPGSDLEGDARESADLKVGLKMSEIKRRGSSNSDAQKSVSIRLEPRRSGELADHGAKSPRKRVGRKGGTKSLLRSDVLS